MVRRVRGQGRQRRKQTQSTKQRGKRVAKTSGAAAMADHSRLGRGLASLMGDAVEETPAPEQGRKPRRAPIENLKPNPRNPRKNFTDDELEELAVLDPRARHHPADRGARHTRRARYLRDHRRRAALARRATRRLARCADHRRRGDRRAGARIRHHRKRAARRPQSDGGGDRLSGADRRIQSQPGRGGADRRQEPPACGQHAAAVEAVRAGADAGACRPAFGRTCAAAGRAAERAGAGGGNRQSAI